MTSEASCLVLYHTAGCHLCELAQALIAPIAARKGWRITLVDIAGDDDLEERYGVRIPVLCRTSDGREIGWPFDAAAVLAAFSP